MTNTNFLKGVRFFDHGRGERYCAMAISRYIVSYNMEMYFLEDLFLNLVKNAKKVINDPIIVKPEEDIKRYADIASYYNKIFT